MRLLCPGRAGVPSRAVLSSVLVGLLAACATAPVAVPVAAPAVVPTVTRPAPSAAATARLPRPDHIVIVIFENKDVDQVLGTDKAPFLNALAQTGVDFTNAHAEVHPSQPNYLAL